MMSIINMIVNQIMNDPKYNNNPTMQNAFQMYRNGNIQGVEELTRNVCQTQGKDINQIINQAKGLLRK